MNRPSKIIPMNILIFIIYTRVQVFKIFRLSKCFASNTNANASCTVARSRLSILSRTVTAPSRFFFFASVNCGLSSFRHTCLIHQTQFPDSLLSHVEISPLFFPLLVFFFFFLPLFFQLTWHGVSTLKSSVNDICFRSTAQCETFHTSFFDFF